MLRWPSASRSEASRSAGMRSASALPIRISSRLSSFDNAPILDPKMTELLAIKGGSAAVRRKLEPFRGIGARERDAVLQFLDRGTPLSGFHGSAQPTFFGGPEVKAFEAAWCKRFDVAHAISVNS